VRVREMVRVSLADGRLDHGPPDPINPTNPPEKNPTRPSDGLGSS